MTISVASAPTIMVAGSAAGVADGVASGSGVTVAVATGVGDDGDDAVTSLWDWSVLHAARVSRAAAAMTVRASGRRITKSSRL